MPHIAFELSYCFLDFLSFEESVQTCGIVGDVSVVCVWFFVDCTREHPSCEYVFVWQSYCIVLRIESTGFCKSPTCVRIVYPEQWGCTSEFAGWFVIYIFNWADSNDSAFDYRTFFVEEPVFLDTEGFDVLAWEIVGNDCVIPVVRFYSTLDMDSIDAVDLAVRLQQFTDKKISPEEFKQIRTIGDVVNCLYNLNIFQLQLRKK